LQYCSHWRDIRTTLKTGTFPLVDLRSPKEFALGHIPRAINIPLLDNEERHQVGKLYKEGGKREAVHLGLEIFAAKAERFLFQIEQLAPQRTIAVHCWRGGMRSRLVGYWLSLAGFEVSILKGGYKSFRRDVHEGLDELAAHPKIVLNGRTGSGKTLFLKNFAREQRAIDLEGLAHHRGSTFGGLAQEQDSPTQQNFENQIYDAYLDSKKSPKLLFEIENFIGPVCVPQRIRESLQLAPMIFLSREFEDRVQLLTQIYCENWDDEAEKQFQSNLVLLRKYISHEEEQKILHAIQRKDFSYAISQLLRLRYDRVYDKSLKRHQLQAIAHFNLSSDAEAAKVFVENALA